jgi:hypothetical protein
MGNDERPSRIAEFKFERRRREERHKLLWVDVVVKGIKSFEQWCY